MLVDHKLKSESFVGKNVKALPDNPSQAGITAAQLKDAFDKSGETVIATSLNAVIDILSGGEGASNIGTVGGSTVQAHIDRRDNPHLATPQQLGLERVNNTSDYEKPVSWLTQQEIDNLKANVLTKDNMFPYEPTELFHPVTLKKLQDAQFNSGSVSSVFGQGGDIITLDCGDWDMSAVEAHNRSAFAHSAMVVDGQTTEPLYDSDNLEQHKVNDNVHSNVIVNGGTF